jgi:hypothetical protein
MSRARSGVPSDALVERVRAAYLDGLVPKQIAHLVGRTTRTVQKALVPRPKHHCSCHACIRDRRQPARGTNTGRPAVWSESGHVV